MSGGIIAGGPGGPPLRDTKLVFFDLQTTGASPATGNPLEAAWGIGAAVDDGPLLVESAIIQQPHDEPVPRRIQALTGITDGDMEACVEWHSVCGQVLNTLAQADRQALVIHYAQFERPFLAEAIESDLFCTHQIATRIFPNLPSRGIRGLAGYFGFPLEECKRASTHVIATFEIWKNLVGLLQERGVNTWDELVHWLASMPKSRRTKYEYPLDRGIRLSVPDSPGIYKMLSCKGDVLYVGKATSLKDRVNSYFRGRRKKDPRKLEMLTQAWDIKVEPCPTVLEACLREVQAIKRLRPPYNIAMNSGNAPLLYYSADFDQMSIAKSEKFPYGPFRTEWVMDSFIRMLNSLRSGKWDSLVFYDEPPAEIIEAGFDMFLQNHSRCREEFLNSRRGLAIGGMFLRAKRREHPEATEDILEEESQESQESEENEEVTPERVAERCERLLRHAAAAYFLSRRLARLSACEVMFVDGGVESSVEVDEHLQDVDSFDYLRVLATELSRLRKQNGQIRIHYRAFRNTAILVR